jgi:hypothetical protein
MPGTKKATLILCSWSASKASEKRPPKDMMVSKASDPQISEVMMGLYQSSKNKSYY